MLPFQRISLSSRSHRAPNVNPLWDKWAGQILSSGKKLGFYRYASGGDPIAEANYFWTYARNTQVEQSSSWTGKPDTIIVCQTLLGAKPWLRSYCPTIRHNPWVTSSPAYNSFKNCHYPLWIIPLTTPTGCSHPDHGMREPTPAQYANTLQ